MDPRKKLKNLANPSYVTGLILAGFTKLAHLAFLDLAKYLLKKLSGRLLGLPDPFRLPRRYKLPSFCLSILGTAFLWGTLLGLFVRGPEGPSFLWFLFLTASFYGLALGVLVLHRTRTFSLVKRFIFRIKRIGKKIGKIFRIWFP